MNKTININLAGIIFYVDEDAYAHFSNYLQSIKAQFVNAEEREEIIADIESRIAELLQNKVNDAKQVINRADVDEIIAVMGSPEDFSTDDDEESSHQKSTSSSHQNTSGTYNYAGPKRLFRNPDDKILSGVSSGIAAYFGIDTIWVRLIWIALFFGWGTGFFIYVILWIVMPKANTTAQKLQMRGEPININNIEKAVKEEMKDVKDRFNSFKNSGKAQTTSEKVKNTAEDIATALLSVLKQIFLFVFKFIGVILMIVGVFILIGLFSLFLGNDFNVNGNAIDWSNLSGYLSALFVTSTQKSIFLVGVLMLALAPIIGIILLGMRILFNYRSQGKFTAAGLTVVTILGFILLFSTLTLLVRGFASEATYTETIELGGAHKAYALQVSDFVDDQRPYDLDWTITDKYQILADVSVDVQSTDQAFPYIELMTTSNGKNRLEARQRAKNYEYYHETNDTIINIADYFLVPTTENYRKQELDVVLYLPVGYQVYLDESTMNVIYDIDNITDTRDENMLGHYWVMTQNGLACMDCNDDRSNWKSDEEWKDYEDDFTDEAKKFENEELRLKEAEQKLKEAEKEIEKIKNDLKKK